MEKEAPGLWYGCPNIQTERHHRNTKCNGSAKFKLPLMACSQNAEYNGTEKHQIFGKRPLLTSFCFNLAFYRCVDFLARVFSPDPLVFSDVIDDTQIVSFFVLYIEGLKYRRNKQAKIYRNFFQPSVSTSRYLL